MAEALIQSTDGKGYFTTTLTAAIATTGATTMQVAALPAGLTAGDLFSAKFDDESETLTCTVPASGLVVTIARNEDGANGAAATHANGATLYLGILTKRALTALLKQPTWGGTGQSTWTLGDTLYSDAANSLAKLGGNTTATKKFLRQTGDGTNSAAPAWDTLVAGDIPSLAASIITSGTLPVARGGTGVTTSTGTTNVVLSNSPTIVTPAITTSAIITTSTASVAIQSISTVAQDDNIGHIQAYYNGTSTIANASITAKNYQGTSQFMQWDVFGLRFGSRIVTNTGVGRVYFTYASDSVGMILDESGNLSLGTGLPSARLSVAEKLLVTSAGVCTKYNNIATVSNGVPSELATVDLATQSAAISATTLYTPAATGMYRISAYLQLTRAATTSSNMGGVTITYNDGDGNVAQSDVMPLASTNGAITLSSLLNTTNANMNGSLIIYAKAGVAIQYAIGYTSSGATTMQYAVHLKLEAL